MTGKQRLLGLAAGFAALLAAHGQPAAAPPKPAPAAEHQARTKPPDSKIRLTLLEAKKLALQQSPTLALAKARIDGAAARVAEAKSSYWPTLDVSFGATRNQDRATRPLRAYDQNTRYHLGLSADWLLFDGFQRRFTRLLAEFDHATALANNVDAQRLLLQAVSAAFYSAILAQDSMDIAKEDAEFNRVLHADARKRQEGGIATASEVLNFQLQVGNAEVDYIAAEKAWRIAIVALGELLAITQDDIWESIVLTPPADDLLSQTVELSELLAYARQHRPDLARVQNDILAANTAIQAARSSWYPSLRLFADYGYERADSLHFNENLDREVSFGLSASWNLFEGFRTQALLNRAEAELAAARQSQKELELAIESEIRQNHLALESSRRQLALQESILATAKEIRDLVHQEYLGGTTTITRLNEVQTDVTISAAARSQAYIQVFYSLELLGASTGRILLLEEQE
jgi:outer membrane protein